ncbi:MAG TPA: GNAT family N-acetyltransferase [Magnetospirillaceae bacterium]|jgi:GNAT superfamily N-acetyltransferase
MSSLLPLAPADYDAWYPLWQGYLTFYQSSVADDVTKLTFARLTGGQEPMGGFIARDEAGDAIGITHWITHRSCWTAGDYCYLQDLFVASGARKRGTGRALIEAVYVKAIAMGCSRVHWLTQESNRTAQRLYDEVAARSGFIQYRKILD